MSTGTKSVPTVPIGADGLEGWSSCCEAAVTFHDTTLCCKACWQEVTPVTLDGAAGQELSRIVNEVITGDLSADEGVAQQRALLGTEVK